MQCAFAKPNGRGGYCFPDASRLKKVGGTAADPLQRAAWRGILVPAPDQIGRNKQTVAKKLATDAPTTTSTLMVDAPNQAGIHVTVSEMATLAALQHNSGRA